MLTARLPAPIASPPPGASSRTPERVLVVELRGQSLAFDLREVQELRGASPLTRIAGSPRAMLGMLELRGDVLPVFDLGELLDLGSTANGPVLVLLQHEGFRFALRADDLHDVLDMAPDAWRAAPAVAADSPVHGVCCHGGRMLTLLDPGRLLRLARH